MFDAPLPEFEVPSSPRRAGHPGKRYHSSVAKAVVTVASGLSVSALVFVGASAMLKTPSTSSPTTVPPTTNTTVAPATPAPTPPVVKAPTQVLSSDEVSTNPAPPTTVPVSTPTLAPTTSPTSYPSDEGAGSSSGGEGDDR